MENNRIVKSLSIVFVGGALLLAPFFVFAYDDTTTHPALTQEIVKFFNASFTDRKINDADAELIIQGSIDEDKDPKWLRHFYDPVRQRGLVLLENNFTKYPELAAIVGGTRKEFKSSKNWSQDTAAQTGIYGITAGIFTSYFGGREDYSWERAIYDYAWKDKKRGLKGLGHILHLLEDATVPDHTRNDPHPPILDFGSPYEFWTKKFNRTSISIDTKGNAPTLLPTLNNYFNSLAKYSNENFFSKDTISSNEYKNINFIAEKIEPLSDGIYYRFGIRKDPNGISYKLVRIEREIGTAKTTYSIQDLDNNVLSDYWSLLSKQAVLHGAGAVKLFFDEVEKEKQTKILYEKNKSWVNRGWNKIAGGFSGVIGAFWSKNPKITAGPQFAAISQAINTPYAPATNTPKTTASAISLPQNIPPAEISTKTIAAKLPPLPPPENPQTKNPRTVNPLQSYTSPSPVFREGNGEIPPPPAPAESLPQPFPEESKDTATSSPPVDSEGPAIDFFIRECDQSLSRDSCLIPPETLNLSWSSFSTDLSYFRIECAINDSPCENFTIGTTTATTTTYTSEIKNGIFIFTVTAIDTSGNENNATKKVAFSQHPVVINEVAWGGTSTERSQDQWIELYNTTSETADLADIQLVSLGKDTNIRLSGNIPPYGYYIIENNAEVMSDIPADLTAPFGTTSMPYLSGSGETLALTHQGIIIDQTPDPAQCRGWCEGIGSPYYWSMERYDPEAPGSNQENWGHWQGFLARGNNRDGLAINGTPQKRNSINYLIEKNGQLLLQDKTLTKAKSPYLIIADFTVPEGKTLTVEPGAIIKLWGGALIVDGMLLASGTTKEPVVFTSIHDDDCGIGGCEDTDATITPPNPGDWRAITIRANDSEINHAIIRYGGIEDPREWPWVNLKIKNADAVIANSTIEHSSTFGVYLENSSSLIVSNLIRHNSRNIPGQRRGVGIFIDGGNPTVKNNIITQNTVGIDIEDSATPEILQNTFAQNTDEAIVTNGSYATFRQNNAYENGTNGILLTGGTTQDYELAPDLPYIIPNIGYTTASGTIFTILPGTIIKAAGPLTFNGKLTAQGAPEQKIIITSIHDDEYGGDTNTATTTPREGDWGTLYLGPGANSSVLSHILIRYGGQMSPRSTTQGTVEVEESSVEISNATIEKSYRTGLFLKNSPATSVASSIIQETQEPNNPETEPAFGLFLENSKTIIKDTLFKNNKVGIHAVGAYSIENNGGILFENNTVDTVPADLLP